MTSNRLRLVALIGAVGIQLRSIILAVPPVLPAVREDLHLSFTAAGALTALPVLCLGAAAVPGAMLVNRFGARLIVGAGTIGLGVAALLRLAPPTPAALFAFSAVMALCVATVQPAMVTALRGWFPNAVQQASTAFSTSLTLGGLGGSVLSIHLLALGGWRGSFVIWGIPALLAGLVWLAVAPARGDHHRPEPGGLGELVRDRQVWHVAAMFGIQSLVYYGSASWIPFELQRTGPGYLSLVLLLLNGIPLPVVALLAIVEWPWASSRPFYVLAGLLMTMGTAGFALGLTGIAWLCGAAIGVSTGMTFAGSNALPPLFARVPGAVAGYAAIVLTVGYAISFAGPLGGGILVDRTHQLGSPFWLMATTAVALIGLGMTLPRTRIMR